MPSDAHKITIDDKELKEAIKKMRNAPELLDPAFKQTATDSLRRLVANTNKQSGTTARNWKPKTHGQASYEIANDSTTDDKKYLIVDILNKGRREVYPIHAKKLYIPLTDKGRARDAGAQYGIDFVLADKAKAFAGTGFLDTELEVAGKELAEKVMKIIKGVA